MDVLTLFILGPVLTVKALEDILTLYLEDSFEVLEKLLLF